MNVVIALAVLACAGPDRSTPPTPRMPEPYRARAPIKTLMRDGPTFHFIPRQGPPLVDVVVRIGAGARDDPPDQPGLAAWTADMLTEGAGTLDALQLADEIDFLGAQLTVEPGWDATVAHLHVPAARLRPALKLLRSVLRRPRLTAEDWERLKQQQLNGFLAERDSPWQLAGRARSRALFGESRYARPLAGDAISLEPTRVQDLQAFHERFYRIDNVEFMIAGNASLEKVNDDVRAVFLRWRPLRAALDRRPVKQFTARSPRRLIFVDKPGAAQSILYASALAPDGLGALDHEVEVMNTLLGGSFTSRLNQNLREEHQYSYGARSSFNVNDEVRTFNARTAVQTDVTALALTELWAELKRIRSYVVDDEAERSRNYTALTFPTEMATGRSTARFWSWALAHKLAPPEVSAYPARVLSVDQTAALKAARRSIDLDHMQIIIVGDKAKVLKSVEALGLGPIEVWTVDELFAR